MTLNQIPEWLTENPATEHVEIPVVTKVQELPLDKLTWKNFERLCLRLVRKDSKVEFCYFYGEEGESQEGIDLFAESDMAEKYDVYQCKRVKNFSPIKIKNAVEKFIDGEFSPKTNKFYLCTSESLSSRKRMDEIKKQKEILSSKHDIKLRLFDKGSIEEKLKTMPEIVADFFGENWVKAFCHNETIEHIKSTKEKKDLIMIALNSDENLGSQDDDEILAIIQEVSLKMSAGSSDNYKVVFSKEEEELQLLKEINKKTSLTPQERLRKLRIEASVEYSKKCRKKNEEFIRTYFKLTNSSYGSREYSFEEKVDIFKNMLDTQYFLSSHQGDGVSLKIHKEEDVSVNFRIYLTATEWDQFEREIRNYISMGIQNSVSVKQIPKDIFIKRVIPKYIRALGKQMELEGSLDFIKGSWYVYED
ncbi:hypothetical protein [Halobacillus litoralis]|uniref:hypothetical protein n=1 Tax=Halobacillus litoralis TaxID=45668 RepID=UPI001368E9C5|nr:hypothetical protein [Halobacillus litoralis]MYL37356.1 hypothetical protein [Halobacillus litoralis]